MDDTERPDKAIRPRARPTRLAVAPWAGLAGLAARPPLRQGHAVLGATVADLTFVTWVITVPILFGTALLNTDGDLARHIRVGSEFMRRGLLHRDIFSFTRPGAAFVPYEWLSEIAYALVHATMGLAGVAVFAGILIALTYALLVRFLARAGVDPLLAWLTGMAAAFLGVSHWLARPHLFTLLGTICLIALLERRDGQLRWFAPLFALWANLHGGYIFGLAVIGLYLVGDAAEWRLGDHPEQWRARARFHAAALAISFAGSLLTPSGIRLLPHVTGYLGQSYLLDSTDEYMSPDFHSPGGKVFLLALCAVFALLAMRRKRLSYPHLILVLAMTAFALTSQRNIPLFGLVALPILALHLDPLWRRLRVRALRQARAAIASGNGRGSWLLWPAIAAAAMLSLAVFQPRDGGLVPGHFDSQVFPVEAVARARLAGVGPRVFNYFPWGGYMLRAWPERKVFIDGQTDFYGEAVARDYDHVQSLQPGWRDVLNRWAITAVLFPTDSRLVAALTREPGWFIWHRDAVATVLVRPPGASAGGEPAAERAAPQQPVSAR